VTSSSPSSRSSSSAASAAGDWHPSSWRSYPAAQQPEWPDPNELDSVVKELRDWPPLVFAGEARELTAQLGRVAEGKAFLLQAGDCAESFDARADNIREKLRVILQMAVVLTYSGGVPVVKVGRIAGQYAKPRSSGAETIDGVTLPSFRGHVVNDIGFTAAARVPEPRRILDAYHHSAATLNLLRAFTKGGFADLGRVHAWNREFVAASPEGRRYSELADGIERALQFMKACGLTTEAEAQLHQTDLYTSHEALILGYEEALTRQDSLTGDWYDCSAHMLWIGERTRQLDAAHVHFLSGVKNPLGCKIGPTVTAADVLALCEALNPERIPGRLTLISRMGSDKVLDSLTPLLIAVRDAGHPVVWACDPMHGNTFTAPSGHKTRHFDDVMRELEGFFAAHREAGTFPGGVHIELTGDDVTECLGGSHEIVHDSLADRYETMCDPRLNSRQSVDLAFRIAELLRA
jgi:3-deoxy-7-phosphoheptulonate synthase